MSVAKWEPKRWAPTMRESAHGDWVDLEDALEAIEARDQRIAALEAEVARLKAINDTLRSDRAWLAGLADGAPIDVDGGMR